MTQEQFMDAVMEQLFVRGFVCPPRPSVSICVQAEWARLGPLTDPVSFAANRFRRYQGEGPGVRDSPLQRPVQASSG